MNFVPPPRSPREVKGLDVIKAEGKKSQKKEEGFFDRILDWIKGQFWGGSKQSKKIEVSLSTTEVTKRSVEGVQRKSEELNLLSFKDKEFQEAAGYVDIKRAKLEKSIYKEIAEPFQEAWDSLFKEINNEIVNGKSYDEVFNEFEEEWKQFQIGFDEVFGYAQNGLSPKEIEDLKVYQKTSEFGTELRKLSDRALYEDFKALFTMRWIEELQQNTPLQDSIELIADTKKAENARTAEKLKRLLAEGGPLRVDFLTQAERDDYKKQSYSEEKIEKIEKAKKARYERVLSEVKIQDYGAEEIKIAQTVVGKFFDAFKERFGEKTDMQMWRSVVAREPMLAKAEVLLIQKQYDSIRIEYRRKELLAKQDAGELSPEELVVVEKELGALGSFTDIISLFCKSLLPWNQVKGPDNLRVEGEKVVMNALPVQELGQMLSWVTKSVVGDTYGNIVEYYASWLDKSMLQLGSEVTEGVVNLKNAGQWSVDKNKYIVRDFTIEAKEGMVSRGIKWLMQEVVEPPKRMLEREKMLPWLAKYAKAAAVGGVAAGARELWNGRMPSVEKIGMGATAGVFARAYKGEILTSITFGLPGAVIAAGIVVAIGGTGALFGTGGLFAIGVGAFLLGAFGVWAMYHTKIGENIREAVANFVYSSEAVWFDTWNDKVERADLGRVCFNQVATIAEARRGQMYLRTELAQDPRYTSLEDICSDLSLSLKTKDEFLEGVKRQPRVLNEPGQFKELLKLIKIPTVLEELNKVNELNETNVDQLIKLYRAKNEGTLKVGLNGRYENLKNEFQIFDARLLNVMGELEDKKNENLLKDDNKLKRFLRGEGIGEEVINRVFEAVNKSRSKKTVTEEAGVVTRGFSGVVGTVGGVLGMTSNVANYLGSFWIDEKSTEEIEAPKLTKMEENLQKQVDYDHDEVLVQIALVLREVIKQKDKLADEGEFKKLLGDLGFKSEQIDELYQIYDKRNVRADSSGVKARILADQDLMEKFIVDQDRLELGIQNAVLAFDIIVEAQKNGLLKSDADLPTDEELAHIKSQLPSDEVVLAMIKYDEKMHKPSKIPTKIPNDRALMVRFGLLKRNTEGIVPLSKLSLEDQETFNTKKVAYRDNFDRLRIALKRAELIKAAVDALIQTKKDEYVANILLGMSDDEKIERIAERNLKILEEYNL